MIPKILHFVWLQGIDDMPANYRSCFDSWAPLHSSWEIKLWDISTIPELQNDWVWDINNATVQSDVARFELVQRFGGVYLDCDMTCLRSLDSLIEGHAAVVSKRTRDMLASSSFGATPNHPWLTDLVHEITKSRARLVYPGEIRGPIERITRRHPEVVRFDNSLLELTKAAPGAYAVHHKSGTWRDGFEAEITRNHSRPAGKRVMESRWRPQQAT